MARDINMSLTGLGNHQFLNIYSIYNISFMHSQHFYSFESLKEV